MRLEISESVSMILTLPSLFSDNEGHKKMGEKILDVLLEYKELGADEREKAFNRAMIASVLSTVRAFSIERGRMEREWKAIERVKQIREHLLEVFRNLSPLTKGNYWSKAIVIFTSLGFSLRQLPLIWTSPKISPVDDILTGMPIALTISFVVSLVLLEILSKLLEFLFASYFEKRLPHQRDLKWKTESVQKYKQFIDKFTDEAINNYKRYYPETNKLCGFNITSSDEVTKLKNSLVEEHFYL